MAAKPGTQGEVLGDLALASWRRGDAARAEGDLAGARRWLERAHRLLPDDPSIAMALASALLALADPAARALFSRVAAGHDVFAAWLGAAASARLAGESGHAAADLAMALANHAVPDTGELRGLADAVARDGQTPGWCRVGPDRRLGIRPGGARRSVRADGRVVAWRDGEIVPPETRLVSVTMRGRHLLGSPLRVGRMFRVEGVVSVSDGGIAGWAWHPGAPDRAPDLFLAMGGDIPPMRLKLAGAAPDGLGPFVRAAGFEVALRGFAGIVHVRDADGGELAGSPLLPGADRRFAACMARSVAARLAGGAEQADLPASALDGASVPAATRGGPTHAEPAPDRAVAVVIPVHRGLRATLRCIASVRATVPMGTPLLVVDDATPEPALATALDRLAASGGITLIRRMAGGGFPVAANAGLRAAAGLEAKHDVVLLNSDTLVAPGWLVALRAAVHAAADVGTATPLSNDATLVSYPHAGGGNPPPSPAAFRRVAALAARVNHGVAVEIPTAVGFCMYIRRECLDAVGPLREDLFAQGYGEENDFCLRARHLGWRHVAAPGVFVAHLGGASFGAARQALLARNGAVIERRYPGYDALIAAHGVLDPLAPARFRLDAGRWAAGRAAGATILVTHDSGGGVERAVRQRCAALRAAGRRAIVLRPVRRREGDPAPGHPGDAYHKGSCEVGDGTEGGYPNLRFAIPGELTAVARLLRRDRPDRVELHHLLGHHHAVTGLAALLAVPLDIHVHDYACICPRVTLIGPERRFCGEPLDPAVCDACVADAGRVIEETISAGALRARSAADFAAAGRVVAPARDVARRLDRHFPGLLVHLEPFDRATQGRPPPSARPGGPSRVVVIGGIGLEKGYEALLGCARDAAARGLRLEFVVVGHTMDDGRLFDTGRVFVTGPYAEADGEALARAQGAHLAWLPSICPETWSFTLSLAWQAGLPAAVFDIGAPADRVRAEVAAGRAGWVLPLGAPPATINNALLAASGHARSARFLLQNHVEKFTPERLGAYIHA